MEASEPGCPTDADLRQMFAYNVFFKCPSSTLVYPAVSGESRAEESVFALDKNIRCALLFLKLYPVEGVLQLDLLPVMKLVDKIGS